MYFLLISAWNPQLVCDFVGGKPDFESTCLTRRGLWASQYCTLKDRSFSQVQGSLPQDLPVLTRLQNMSVIAFTRKSSSGNRQDARVTESLSHRSFWPLPSFISFVTRHLRAITWPHVVTLLLLLVSESFIKTYSTRMEARNAMHLCLKGSPSNSRAYLRPMRVQTVATRGLCWLIVLLHLVATHELWIEPLPVNRH